MRTQVIPGLVLASGSPRRAELLRQIGFDFEIIHADVDESLREDESPTDYVARLAFAKAHAVATKQAELSVVLGADTVVVINDTILGKPQHIGDAKGMLQKLSERWHDVLTGVAIISNASDEKPRQFVTRTRVKFRALAEAEIDAYVQTNEPNDKAGAYGIQGSAAAFVERIDGSYSNVVGLPLCEATAVLHQFGLRSLLT